MRVLITGGSSRLGSYLNKELSGKFQVMSTYQNNPIYGDGFSAIKMDLTNPESINEVFNYFRPDVVVHAAAVSNPARANAVNPADVFKINVKGSELIAKKCAELGARIIYTSTDQVYAGYRGTYLKENAKLVPLSKYAETKLMGEVKIRQAANDYLILRTALLYEIIEGESPNYLHNIYYNLKAGKQAKVFYDQYRSPLAMYDAARIIGILISKNVTGEIINFGGPGKLDRMEMAVILCEEAGLDKSLLIKTSMFSIPNLPKVQDVSMNIDALKKLGIAPIDYREAVRKILGVLNN